MSECRYFSTIVARTRQALRDLAEQEVDVVQATARDAGDGRFTIEGLVTIEEVERLVEGGYEVTLHEEASKRARARTETVEFEQWLGDMGA